MVKFVGPEGVNAVGAPVTTTSDHIEVNGSKVYVTDVDPGGPDRTVWIDNTP